MHYIRAGDDNVFQQIDFARDLRRCGALVRAVHGAVVRHLRQPTRTSCGPTCVAMIADVGPQDVINRLVSQPGRTKRGHSCSMLDLSRLLKEYNFVLGDRGKTRVDRGIIRWHHRTPAGQFRQGWHCLVIWDGLVYDPCQDTPVVDVEWFDTHSEDKLLFYEVSPMA